MLNLLKTASSKLIQDPVGSLLQMVTSGVFFLLLWLTPIHAGMAASGLPDRSPVTVPVFETVSVVEVDLLGNSLNTDDISTEKISQFVQAYMQVLTLIEQRENELQGAELESESQQIQQEIEAEAVALIQKTGLTLQEYLQLLSLTNIDPEFGERVAAQLQEATT